jgi:hypothetical protein
MINNSITETGNKNFRRGGSALHGGGWAPSIPPSGYVTTLEKINSSISWCILCSTINYRINVENLTSVNLKQHDILTSHNIFHTMIIWKKEILKIAY